MTVDCVVGHCNGVIVVVIVQGVAFIIGVAVLINVVVFVVVVVGGVFTIVAILKKDSWSNQTLLNLVFGIFIYSL